MVDSIGKGRVRVAVVGLGWVGQELTKAALEDGRVELVGLADVDPNKAGRDVGELLGERRLGMEIESSVKKMLDRAKPAVVLVTTSSKVDEVLPVVRQCAAAGAHVVTSCEDLAEPNDLEIRKRRRLEALLQDRGTILLATGINPGFAMDRLPITLAQATRSVRRVRVKRVIDASTRRAQFQAKIGVGMSQTAFKRAVAQGELGHVGLLASLRLVARGLGVSLDRSTEEVVPLIAEQRIASSTLGPVAEGRVRGIRQVARGYRSEQELITLEFVAGIGEPQPRDTIDIVGEPPLHLEGEFAGDSGTIATMLSAVPAIYGLSPGLHSVLELPLAAELGVQGAGARDEGAERLRELTQLPARTQHITEHHIQLTEGSPTPRKRR